jgi:uracil-DNA glycosylase
MADINCPQWLALLAHEQQQPYFAKLASKVQQARQAGPVYPPQSEVFNAFAYTPWADTRVVIVGQDPYHQPGQAQGLSFSVPAGVKVPPSLRNIYKALAQDMDNFAVPSHGDLRSWAEQGVLLLNTVLTVPQGQAHGHAKWGWETFTDAVMTRLNAHPQPVVFMLWGKHAQSKGKVITNPHHVCLHSVHPSPLSAHRGFFQCQHFSQANQYLSDAGRGVIDWSSVCDTTLQQKQQRQQKLAF